MHLKFFFSAIYNITIVSDLVGSTYLITGVQARKRGPSWQFWQWGRHRYFHKERERECEDSTGGEGGGEKERTRANYLWNKSDLHANTVIIMVHARRDRARSKKARNEKVEVEGEELGGVRMGRHTNITSCAFLFLFHYCKTCIWAHNLFSHSLWRKSKI